ncbi:hypothetical protein V6N13_131469 [Hibiscus sabdariffa]|uniref:FRIGIDA-like protein n=1 Tax=Hibiscus sabdariffa TaxID=183260 RepID=A0ABR2D800_9ROSI
MEDLKKELKMGELKREILRNSLEQASAKASSILVFTFQWKELEKHFELVQQSIEKRLDFVESREKELESTTRILREREEEIGLHERELSRKIEECNVELKFKKEEIDRMQKLLEECLSEFESKNEELDLVRKSVEDCSKELGLKKEELCSVQKSISECCEDLEGKELELECLRNSIKECSDQLDVKQNELVRSREMVEEQSKQLIENEKKQDSFKSLIQDYEEELEAKKEKYEALEKSVAVLAAKLDYNEKKLRSIDEKISDRLQELCSRDAELDSLLKSIDGRRKQLEAKEEELHSKENQLKSVRISIEGCTKQLGAKEQELTSVKNSTLNCTRQLESKQQQLEAIQKSQEEISGMLESKEKQLDLVVKACGERLQEADVKEKHLDSVKRSLDERLDKLEREKRQFEARVRQFELEEKQFDSVKKSVEQRSKDLELEEKQLDSVKKSVEQRSKELELKEKKLTNALHSQVSSDNPVSFFSQAHGISNVESGDVLMLELTNKQIVFALMMTQIKTENPENFIIFNGIETSTADLVAGARMDGMDSLSILDEHLDEPDLIKNEVLRALQNSPDPAKFVLDLMLEISSQHKKNDGSGLEESVLKISLLMLEQLLQVSPHVQAQPNVKTDALKLANEWKTRMKLSAENSMEILCFLQFVAAFGLASSLNADEIFKLLVTTAQHQQARNICQLLGFTDMIPEFVDGLIARKQYIEAVRFVCALDCKDKWPPKQLLDLFVKDINRVASDRFMIGKNSPEVLQQKATEEQIVSLKSIIECVKDCKLEPHVPVEVIEKCISELEKHMMYLPFSAVRPGVQGSATCNTGPSVPGNQPSPVPAVQQQFQGGIYASTMGTQRQGQFHGGLNASAPGTRPHGPSNKHARAAGIVFNSHTPRVPIQPQQQFQGMINASTPGNRPQGPSNKRARTAGIVINSYTPQVPTLNPNIRRASQHGLDVPCNPGITRLGSAANLENSSTSATRQSNVAEENRLIHDRPKQP